jgi:hypothetical protein
LKAWSTSSACREEPSDGVGVVAERAYGGHGRGVVSDDDDVERIRHDAIVRSIIAVRTHP